MNTEVANYGGRQPNNFQYIKQFHNTSSNIVLWMYKKISEVMYITPCDQVHNVLIPKDLYVYGTINTPSDKILKENIEQITNNECDRILELHPKKYNFINDSSKKVHYGLIAQDVEEQYPLLVNETDCISEEDTETTIKTVNYMELIPIMIRKMQHMQNEINDLRKLTEL